MTRFRLCVLAFAASLILSSCTQYDLARLAGDDTAGRNNGTPGSDLARQFLIEQLKPISQGLNSGASGDAAYTQTLPGGTNVVAVIPGTDLAGKYVVVGAHYDHLGSSCQSKSSGDQICNGATDNAAGVAAVLAIGCDRCAANQAALDDRAAFGSDDVSTVLGHAATVIISLLPKGDCDGFLRPAEEQQARALEGFVLHSHSR